MPSVERDDSRSSENRLKHQHSISSSDGSRAMVPMWDSSDPERAPPPLPMNPSSPLTTSRPNTSQAIQSAHAALTERARENAFTASVAKRIETSPERSLIKGAAHKRMQSFHTGNVKDLSSFIEHGAQLSAPNSPEKRDRRPSTPLLKDSPEKSSSRDTTPTPSAREASVSNTPTMRPSLRRPPHGSLGENTPPRSVGMLALQDMPHRETDLPLANITNDSKALTRTPQSFDAISSQISSLTGICTSLQREMAQLSRRSKDNATDLVSLKEATNARDEDIRKSLQELVSNITESPILSTHGLHGGLGSLFIDSKAHYSPNASIASRNPTTYSLPRIPSPTSFAMAFDRESTPSLHADSGASIALLEKILREMGTKEGQDNLVSRLSEVAETLARDGISTAKKIDGLLEYIKENASSMTLLPSHDSYPKRGRNVSYEQTPRLELDFDALRSGPVVQPLGPGNNKANRRLSGNKPADLITDDMLKIIRTVKDSVAQGGGLTAEVKALVRELRGEVLGMGRDIGRKLEEANRQAESTDVKQDPNHIANVIETGLDDLKLQLDNIMRENRRQSASSVASRVDYQEIYKAVRSAVADQPRSPQQAPLSKAAIVDAVKEAWENYKPDIELQHFGLEREELLATLREGIEEFAPRHDQQEPGASREEVFAAVVEGLKHFQPPRVETEASLSRDEILEAVRECLEEFEFPSAPAPEQRSPEHTRDDMVGAVIEGLHGFDFTAIIAEAIGHHLPSISKDDVFDAVRASLEDFDLASSSKDKSAGSVISIEDVGEAVREGLRGFDFGANSTSIVTAQVNAITREDVYDAVRIGLETAPLPSDTVGEQVIARLEDVLETMRNEFQAVSEEAKQNVAASGRDTEQVLDATKDGFEKLRVDIEAHVDRAIDTLGPSDALASIHDTLNAIREDVESSRGHQAPEATQILLAELEKMRESMTMSMVRSGSTLDREEFLHELKTGLDNLRADIDRPKDSSESILSGTSEILDALQDGLTSLRVDVEKIGNKPVDMTVNYEILDTLRAGLEGVRADIDQLKEQGQSDRTIAELQGGAVIPAPLDDTVNNLKRADIDNLEVLITQLRIKVEAMDSMPDRPMPGQVMREDLNDIELTLHGVKETVDGMSTRIPDISSGAATREDVEAVETLLRNTKAKVEEMNSEHGVNKDHLDAVEVAVLETREALTNLASHLEDVIKREEMLSVEQVIRDVLLTLAEIKEQAAEEAKDLEKVTKTDVQAIEAVCLDLKTSIETQLMSDVADLASKNDIIHLGTMLKEFKGRVEVHAEAITKAFEDRQAEVVGVGERVVELKDYLREFKEAIREKLDDGASGIESLGKLMDGMTLAIKQNGTLSDEVKVVLDTLKVEFENSNAGVVGSKLETDKQFQETWDLFETKLEEKFGALMTKYDDAQLAAEDKSKTDELKQVEIEAALLSTKTAAEDLKLLTDSLSTNLTESVDKLDESSKTVFNRVEDTFSRVEETHADAKAEHQLTREQVFKVIHATEAAQKSMDEHQSKISESLKDVLQIVGQHYEHSKFSSTTLQETIAQRTMPPETPLLTEPPIVEKYDDKLVHEKLDKLVDHASNTEKSSVQLETLDKMHQQMLATAAEISRFVQTQTQRIEAEHGDKERAAEVAATDLEKHLLAQQAAESRVASLEAEESRLAETIASMRATRESLAQQKTQLSADVSSLETALAIRREELHAMEARAEGLERRILEGVMDHSRALLLSKTPKNSDAMNRTRVSSQALSTTGSIASSTAPRVSHTTQSAMKMAMSGKRGVLGVPGSNANARRILSLNQITGNSAHGVTSGGFIGRSQSVKAPKHSQDVRKGSWGGGMGLAARYNELNKENLALVGESEEEDGLGAEAQQDMEDEECRRASRGTTIVTGAGTLLSDSMDGSTEYTESISELSDDETETETGTIADDETMLPTAGEGLTV